MAWSDYPKMMRNWQEREEQVKAKALTMSDEPYTYAGLNEWAEDKYPHEGAAAVAKRYSMADLMREHSVITRWLCAPISDDVRVRWLDALDAVCEEIGVRFEALAKQANENLPHQIRNLRGNGR